MSGAYVLNKGSIARSVSWHLWHCCLCGKEECNCVCVGSRSGGGRLCKAMAPKRTKAPDVDAQHLVDLLCAHVAKVGVSSSFDLGDHGSLVVQQAIRGAALAGRLVC